MILAQISERAPACFAQATQGLRLLRRRPCRNVMIMISRVRRFEAEVEGRRG
jgi:hypothetical protein